MTHVFLENNKYFKVFFSVKCKKNIKHLSYHEEWFFLMATQWGYSDLKHVIHFMYAEL